MKKIVVLFLVIVCLVVTVGCSCNTPKDERLQVFGEWLDAEGFVSGLSQDDFVAKIGVYEYEGAALSTILYGIPLNMTNGGGYMMRSSNASGLVSGLQSEYHLKDDQTFADRSNSFYTDRNLAGLPLPGGVMIGNDLATVLDKFGVTVDPLKDFKADANTMTDMTLLSGKNGRLYLQDMTKAFGEPAYLYPYQLIYTETVENEQGAEVTRNILFSFTSDGKVLLDRVDIVISEIYPE